MYHTPELQVNKLSMTDILHQVHHHRPYPPRSFHLPTSYKESATFFSSDHVPPLQPSPTLSPPHILPHGRHKPQSTALHRKSLHRRPPQTLASRLLLGAHRSARTAAPAHRPRRPSAGGVRGDPHRAGRVRGRPRRRLERGRAAVPLPPLGGRGWRSGWKRVDAAVELVVDAWRTVKGGVERLGESRRVRQRLRATIRFLRCLT